MRASFHSHAIHGERLIVSRCFLALSFSVCLSFTYLFSSHFFLYSDLNSFFHVDNAKAIFSLCLRQLRSLAPWPNSHLSQGYEPKLPDDFHYSETTEIIFWDDFSDAVPSYLFDAELDDETIGRALSSPLFIQEREEPADRRQAYHSYKESLLPAQSFFTHKNGTTRARTVFVQTKNQVANWKTDPSGFSLNDKKSIFSLYSR